MSNPFLLSYLGAMFAMITLALAHRFYLMLRLRRSVTTLEQGALEKFRFMFQALDDDHILSISEMIDDEIRRRANLRGSAS